MCLHDRIVEELFAGRSLAALIYLIDFGRELEFELEGRKYFISRDGAEKYVSLWEGKHEDSFGSVYELIEKATINNHTFLSVWEKLKLETLF